MSDGQKTVNTLTRRTFLKSTGSVAAAAGVAAGSLTLGPLTVEAAPMPKKWNETYDVVVIGSGFAGLAAAYEAKKAGASVVVLEKMRTPGGNSIINGGVVSAAGSPLQGKQGIKDSPELLLKDMLTAGLNLNHVELAKMVADRSVETVTWTIEELGVKYKEFVNQEGGHSVPRMYNTYNVSGSAIVTRQLAKLKEIGVQPRLQCYLTKIFRDTDGRVKGVEIRDGYVFPKVESGRVKTIRAKKAVVLATGGFGADVAFRLTQDPRLGADVDSTNHPGATAEALKEALSIGCTPVQLSWIQLGPWTSPDEKGFGLAPKFAQSCAAQYGLWIDTKTGRRFVNELADRKIRADAILRAGNKCIAMCDVNGTKQREEFVPKFLEAGIVKKFDTLKDLAAAYGIPYAALQEEVDKYNAAITAGKDSAWGRPIQKNAKPIAQAPFYGMRLSPKVHHTMGGIQINTKAQAVDLMTQRSIPGLYAAGEVTGGVHGAVRLGSCATLDCLTFGRIAGQNAVKEKA